MFICLLKHIKIVQRVYASSSIHWFSFCKSAMLKPGCQISMLVFPVGGRDLRIWAISCLHCSCMWGWLMELGAGIWHHTAASAVPPHP